MTPSIPTLIRIIQDWIPQNFEGFTFGQEIHNETIDWDDTFYYRGWWIGAVKETCVYVLSNRGEKSVDYVARPTEKFNASDPEFFKKLSKAINAAIIIAVNKSI